MKVDEGLDFNLRLDIPLVLCLLQLLNLGVVRGHVGVVVLGVVEFHDLTGDCWLEGAIVVWNNHLISFMNHRARPWLVSYRQDLGG